MNRMKHIYIIGIAGAMALLTSCEFQPEEILLPKTDISLTIKGIEQISYNPESWQLGYNEAKNEFRVVSDKLSDWMIIRCSASPTTEGQIINADLEYTTADDTKKLKDLSFTVEKTSPEGLIWMWNDDRKIGVVIRTL